MDLIFECYDDSFSSDQLRRDANAAYEAILFLQPKLAELFQRRIGVTQSAEAEREIALFGAIRLLNRYHFLEVELPPKNSLKLTHRDQPADAVVKAGTNLTELLSTLKRFDAYVRRDGGHFHEAAIKATRYLEMLASMQSGG